MVAITVVLAAVLYVMVSGLITGPGAQKPLVTFSGVTKVNAVTWTFTVASAQPAVAVSNYKVNFGIGTNTGTAVNMGTNNVNTTVAVSGATPATVGVKWTDLGGTGQVKGGDILTIAFPSAPATGTSLTFYLIYSDGSQVQSQQWQG
jgi:FlaG/FlaF family flagellin (archaellin)